ncbi:MAG: cytochrome c biogenesis protein ResB [Firmicutes bacterium]|nr:cytochrome c biogenesis protein ResB [Bacillota bacterium]
MAQEKPELPQNNIDTFSQLLRFLSSMQLGIILLLALAFISIIATLGEHEAAVQNVYRSWWYLGIMAFTALNLLLCTLRRFRPIMRLAFQPQKNKTVTAISKMQIFRSVDIDFDDENNALNTAKEVLQKNGYKTSMVAGTDGSTVFAERGVWGYLGSLLTHASLLIILLGAMYGSLTGFEERNGGIAGDRFTVENGGFEVAITAVRMELEEDPTIRPRVFSDVIVLKDGQEVTSGTVSINQPLRFAGNTIYHTSFSYVSDITITSLQDGKGYKVQLWDHGQVRLDHEGTILHMMQFFPNFTMNQDGIPSSKNYLPERPVHAGLLIKNGRAVRNVFLQLNKPEVIETAEGEVELLLTGFQHAAIYSITRNLGRPILFGGAVLLIIGLYLCFFLSPRRIWVKYDPENAVLLIGGHSPRQKVFFAQELERMEKEISGREGE